MRDSLRIGRVGGVTIGVHWSLLAVVAFIGAGLANSRLPLDAPGYSSSAYDGAATATAVGLILAVLLHEAGHAIVARRAGMTVDGITLSWMGGVTRIEGDARRPGWEAAIAGIGPAVSLAVGGALIGIRLLAIAAGASALLVACLGWLAVINITLAAFNLVPAAPLDGGRVLHSGIWKLTGDRWKATRVSSRIGITFGTLVVAYGVYGLLQGQGGIQELVVIALGYWLVAAARIEERSGSVQHALDGLTIAELMRPVGAAPGWITIGAFVEQFDSPRPGWVWLLEGWGGGYKSVAAGETIRAVPVPRWGTVRPQDVAAPVDEVAGANPGDGALETLSRTGGRQIVLVVDGGFTVGAVLPSDVEALLTTGRRPVVARPAGAGAH